MVSKGLDKSCAGHMFVGSRALEPKSEDFASSGSIPSNRYM